MTISHWLSLAGLALAFFTTMGAIVRWAMRVEIKDVMQSYVTTLTKDTLKPLKDKLDELATVATRLTDQMSAAQITHTQERAELHSGLRALRDFLDRLDSRVDEYSERLAVVESRDTPLSAPAPARRIRASPKKRTS